MATDDGPLAAERIPTGGNQKPNGRSNKRSRIPPPRALPRIMPSPVSMSRPRSRRLPRSPVLALRQLSEDDSSPDEHGLFYSYVRAEEPPRNHEAKMICKHKECTGLIFDRKDEWSKHMDKHDRPYKCLAKGCEKLQGFTYSGGLLRHEREVHKKHGGPRRSIFCPFTECKRSSGAGFTRKENLAEHIRRVHRRTSTSVDAHGLVSRRDIMEYSELVENSASTHTHTNEYPEGEELTLRRQRTTMGRTPGSQMNFASPQAHEMHALSGAAESLEDSHLFKATRKVREGCRGRGAEGNSVESDSDDSVLESPAPAQMTGGTARTRGMRGAATAQAANSRWFRRGWTLQELLAPHSVRFYDRDGDSLGETLHEPRTSRALRYELNSSLRHETKHRYVRYDDATKRPSTPNRLFKTSIQEVSLRKQPCRRFMYTVSEDNTTNRVAKSRLQVLKSRTSQIF